VLQALVYGFNQAQVVAAEAAVVELDLEEVLVEEQAVQVLELLVALLLCKNIFLQWYQAHPILLR
jgi:hypothetical protein